MIRSEQEELPLWPAPRWPSVSYLADALGLYIGAPLFVGVLFFIGATVVARPLWAAIFVAGILAGIFGFICGRRFLRRLSRLVGAFPHHA
jgi:Flp pilus assembly protein TadB